MKEPIFLFAGPSGSGKSTIVDELAARYGLTHIKSYTTRKQRPGEGAAYHFVDPIQFQKFRDMTNITIYHNQFYGVRTKDIQQGGMYIVDPPGITYMRANYAKTMDIYVIGILATPEERVSRILARGDSYAYAKSRIENDKKTFDIPMETYDLAIHNKDVNETVETAYNFIKAMQEKTELNNRKEAIRIQHDFDYANALYQKHGHDTGCICREPDGSYTGFIGNDAVFSTSGEKLCPVVSKSVVSDKLNSEFYMEAYYTGDWMAEIAIHLTDRPDPLFIIPAPVICTKES